MALRFGGLRLGSLVRCWCVVGVLLVWFLWYLVIWWFGDSCWFGGLLPCSLVP